MNSCSITREKGNFPVYKRNNEAISITFDAEEKPHEEVVTLACDERTCESYVRRIQ